MFLALFSLILLTPPQGFAKDSCQLALEAREHFDIASTERPPTPELVLAFKNNRMGLAPQTVKASELFFSNIGDELKLAKSDSLAMSLKQGDVIEFDDGTREILGNFLGAGNFTHIFSLQSKPGWAIRIPRGVYSKGGPRGALIAYQEYAMTRARLENDPLFIPTIIKGPLVLVRELSPFEDFFSFAQKIKQKSSLSSEDQEKRAAFIQFLVALKGRPGIEDLNTHQIVFFENRWVIHDWGGYLPIEYKSRWHRTYIYFLQDLKKALPDDPVISPMIENIFRNITTGQEMNPSSWSAPQAMGAP